jgi:hypothetical protein
VSTVRELPELPEPAFILTWKFGFVDDVACRFNAPKQSHGDTDTFTTAQMRAYGRECARQEWISVESGLPDEGAEVLALIRPFGNPDNKPLPTAALFMAGVFVDVTDTEVEIHPPSHWMPLPPPPASIAKEET